MDPKQPPAAATSHASLEVSQLGVWTLFVKRSKRCGFTPKLPNLTFMIEGFMQISRFLRDIYRLGPSLFMVIILAEVSGGLDSALKLWAAGRLMSILEGGLVHGQANLDDIYRAFGVQLCALVFSGVLAWMRAHARNVLSHRTKLWFKEELIKAELMMDMKTATEHDGKNNVTSSHAWRSFESLGYMASSMLSVASQLGFVYSQSTTSLGGLAFLLLCLVEPLTQLDIVGLWAGPYVAYATNEDYLRLLSLQQLASIKYRADVLAGDLVGYIIREYQLTREKLGDVSSEYPADVYAQDRKGIASYVFTSAAGQLPMAYHVFNGVTNPGQFSLSNVAILQQSSQGIRQTFLGVIYGTAQFQSTLAHIKLLNNSRKVVNKMKDGVEKYSPMGREKESAGMAIELRDVSFTYPGSEAKAALNNVNLKIEAGQLVVFVGENGSGKTSIIKLLCRLYDTTSGQVLVDGRDIKDYRINDLRQATSTLTQDHHLYPLSIRDNIALGNTTAMDDEAVVIECARLGGALGLIRKFDKGLEMNLQPVRTLISGDLKGLDEDDPLKLEYENAEKRSEISGGEQQRLVAARTFMRFTSGKIKFVAVDEPSSAIDPQGEFELFQRLREARAGKTMVFVTHRFGHLTKHADLIVCMKDGSIAEMGTHNDLLTRAGEYANLYNVQAQAFTDGGN